MTAPAEVMEQQRYQALRLANETRMYRAAAKTALRSGEVGFWELIDARDPRLAGMRVSLLLVAVPGWGPVKAAAVLRSAGIGVDRTVGMITDRQWRLVAANAGQAGWRL